MLLEAPRAKGTLLVLPSVVIRATIGQTWQVGGGQGILGNATSVIQGQVREGKIEKNIGRKANQMAWQGRVPG